MHKNWSKQNKATVPQNLANFKSIPTSLIQHTNHINQNTRQEFRPTSYQLPLACLKDEELMEQVDEIQALKNHSKQIEVTVKRVKHTQNTVFNHAQRNPTSKKKKREEASLEEVW